MYQYRPERPPDHWLAFIACVAHEHALRCANMQTPDESYSIPPEMIEHTLHSLTGENEPPESYVTPDAIIDPIRDAVNRYGEVPVSESAPKMTVEEAEALAEKLAAEMTAHGFPMTGDAVRLMAAMGEWIGPLLQSNKTVSTKATRELGSNSVIAQTCLATLAKGIIAARSHEDVNLQALSILQSVVAIVGALTQPKKLGKHSGG